MRFENFKIKIIEKTDAKSYYQLIENNRVRLEDFLAGIVSKTKSKEDTETFIEQIIKKNAKKLYFPYIVINTTNNELAGFFDVKNIDWNIPKAEIGYFLDKNYIGKGVAKKALDEIMRHFFLNLKFSKLLLRIHIDNKSSISLAEKCDFIREGIIRNDYKKSNGEIVDLIYYGKINLMK